MDPKPTIMAIRTRHRSAAAALAISAGLATPAVAQTWRWDAANGNWNTPGNWFSNSTPGAAGTVHIGDRPAAENATVTLNLSTTIASLHVTDGMTLRTGVYSLTVTGDTTISGLNTTPQSVVYSSDIRVEARDGLSFSTNNLTLSDGARLRMDGGVARIDGVLNVGATTHIDGEGIIGLAGAGTTLVNNGTINPGTEVGLILQQYGGGRYDLDGTTGDGTINMARFSLIDDRGSRLRIEGVGLADSFSGTIMLMSDADLNMNLTEGWVADASSRISVWGTAAGVGQAARIRGGAFEFAGEMEMTGTAAAWLNIESASVELMPQARMILNDASRVTVGGAGTSGVLVRGGVYTVGEGAVLRFDAPTEVRGGEFTTTTVFPGGGRVEFDGPTEWNGVATFNGYARQNGDATVIGPSTINAGRFVMAESIQTTWNINNALVINAESIGTTVGNGVYGALNITGGFLSRLTVNLSDPADYWVVNGPMNLAGDPNIYITRVAGSRFHATGLGPITVSAGRVQITADAWFLGTTVTIGPEAAVLRMTGRTDVSGLSAFQGQGTLSNGTTGHMVLANAVNLSQVGLANDGRLDIGAVDTGTASVDRFSSTPTAVWAIDIGGYLAGTQHDLLIVSGGAASLAGQLEVRLIDAGAGQFLPQVGDEFTVLTSLGVVSGAFSNAPVSQVGGTTFHWGVIYNPHSVVLRLENIVPAPGAATLAALGLLSAARRRRRGGASPGCGA